jgi:hypothetical protein
MKPTRTIRRMLGLSMLTMVLAAPALAGDKAGEGIVTGKKPKGLSVPELDPSVTGSAAVILLGGTLVAFGRRRREQASPTTQSCSTRS